VAATIALAAGFYAVDLEADAAPGFIIQAGDTDISAARRGEAGGGANVRASRTTNVNAKSRTNVNVNRNTNVNVNKRTNVNVNAGRRTNVVVRPVRVWAPRPYYGAIVGGVALGTMIAVSAAGAAPVAPAPNMCWFWVDSVQVQGYWDYCTPPPY
jgi:hypothetical protein